jgi:hypothetical protein
LLLLNLVVGPVETEFLNAGLLFALQADDRCFDPLVMPQPLLILSYGFLERGHFFLLARQIPDAKQNA